MSANEIYYIGVVHADDTSSLGICFPDFPGCISAGDTMDELLEMAKEALGFHIEGTMEDDDPIPHPRSLEEIKKDPETNEWLNGARHIVMIPVSVNLAKAA